jgi:hypothetical protein
MAWVWFPAQSFLLTAIFRPFREFIYPPICWLWGVLRRKLEANDPHSPADKVKIPWNPTSAISYVHTISWWSAGDCTVLSALIYRECHLPSDSYLEQDGFAVHRVHVFWRNKIWIFHGTNYVFCPNFSPGTNRECRSIKIGVDEFVMKTFWPLVRCIVK